LARVASVGRMFYEGVSVKETGCLIGDAAFPLTLTLSLGERGIQRRAVGWRMQKA